MQSEEEEEGSVEVPRYSHDNEARSAAAVTCHACGDRDGESESERERLGTSS